jgi:putative hydrolase
MISIIADMHTHTIASGHAYSTVLELAQEARRKGLKAFAITDHGPALPGAPHQYHFSAMRFIPKSISGVRVFPGIEANILDEHGSIDLDATNLANLEFVMAGFHEQCGFDNQGIDKNTKAMICAMENPLIKAISHPGNPAFPIHIKEIVKTALITQTALEINNSSFGMSRKGSDKTCAELAELIAQFGAPVVIGSDAHIAQGIGIFDNSLELVYSARILEEQVINSSMNKLLAFLGLDV